MGQQESEKKIAEIQDMAYVASEKAKADALLYKAKQEAEANRLKLTPEYLELKNTNQLAQIPKYTMELTFPRCFLKQGLLLHCQMIMAKQTNLLPEEYEF